MATTARHRPPQPPSIPSATSRTKPLHQPLAKRLLFPSLPTTADLPPLLSSPATPPELTAELYDIIALALRAFVNPWWTKITRYDKEFLQELTRILTIVLRALEARILAIDLSSLLFRDVPTLITQHYRDYHNAATKLSTSYAGGGAVSLPQLFHQLQPHMAISPDGRLDQDYFRQVIDHILKVCLPPEDYEPDAERFIVREIVLKVLLNDIIPKITQPWFIHNTILDLLQVESAQDAFETQKPPSPSPTGHASFSLHALLVVFLSAIQFISGACLALIQAYKQAVSTIKRVNNLPPSLSDPLTHLSPRTPPLSFPAPSSSPTISSPHSSSSPSSTDNLLYPVSPHNYASPLLTLLAEIFTIHDRLAATTFFTTLRMLTISFAPFLDRLLPHFLATSLSPATILTTTRIAKRTLFPNGYPAPPPPDPSPEEQTEIRARLETWTPKGALAHIVPLLLGPSPPHTLSAALDPLSSAPCNAHLVVLILDRVLLALFPELAVDRGTAVDSDRDRSVERDKKGNKAGNGGSAGG